MPVTWAFFYLALLLVGAVLAVVFGSLEGFPLHQRLALPRPELARHRRQVHVAHLGAALSGCGGVGLALVSWTRWPHLSVLAASLGGGLLSWLLARLLLRLPCQAILAQQKAVVVRDIPPGGYGQVRIATSGAATILAAQSEEEETLTAGSEVEVVDCHRSVVVVRKLRSE